MEENDLIQEAAREAAEEAVSLFKKQKGNPIEWDWLSALWDWLRSILSRLGAIASEAASAVWSLLGPWLTSLWEMVSTWFTFLWDAVSGFLTSIWEGINTWFTSIWEHINTLYTSLWELVSTWFTSIWGALGAQWEKISYSFTTLLLAMSGWFAGIPEVITSTLADPITDWLSGFIENIWSLFTGVAEGFKRWLQEYWIWILPILGGPVLFTAITGVRLLAEYGGKLAENMIDSIMGYVQRVGRIDPTNAPTIAGALMSLVGTGVVGLSAMTLAGELMHPLKEIGMGHVSAMIGDVINYKVISAAFMGALVGAALTTPLRYYFNYTLRPWLPDRRVMDMSMSRSLFEHPETLVDPDLIEPIKALVGPDGRGFERRMLGYHGFADEWYPVYKELSNTTIGYFALAAVARSGVFDPQWFWESLQRAGYSIRVRQHLYDMYEAESRAEIKALYVGEPISAFKEGWFTEERLKRELTELGVPEKAHPRYVHAAWLKYEVDLLSDRLAGLKEAYRKGLVTDADFTGTLTGWGMATERAEEHLTREQIRRYGKL